MSGRYPYKAIKCLFFHLFPTIKFEQTHRFEMGVDSISEVLRERESYYESYENIFFFE